MTSGVFENRGLHLPDEDYTVKRDDGALDAVMQAMNNNPGFRPTPKLPEPDVPAAPTPEQLKILDELPDKPGFYWVEDIRTNDRNIAYIDKSRAQNTVEHWGHKMDATFGGIGVIERWLMGWTVLSEVAPYKEPIEYENNKKFGAF